MAGSTEPQSRRAASPSARSSVASSATTPPSENSPPSKCGMSRRLNSPPSAIAPKSAPTLRLKFSGLLVPRSTNREKTPSGNRPTSSAKRQKRSLFLIIDAPVPRLVGEAGELAGGLLGDALDRARGP